MRDVSKTSAKSRKAGKKQSSTSARRRGATLPARAERGPAARSNKKRKKRKQIYPKVLVTLGALLILLSSGSIIGMKVLISRYNDAIPQEEMLGDALVGDAESKLEGPLNILMVGLDARPNQPLNQSRADTILILHVPEDRQQAFLVSVPRDLMVQVKPFAKSGYRGGRAKMTESYFHGAQGKGGVAGGMELLASSIKETLGVKFNAAAVINFSSFEKVIDALGGVDMCFDQRVESLHMRMGPNGPVNVEEKPDPDQYGKKIVYEEGVCRRLKSWEALDFSRQRYGLKNGDYDRQRHQQQLVKAIAKEATSKGVVTNPGKLDGVIKAAGQAFVLDTGGVPMVDFVFSLKSLSPDQLITVKTNAGQVTSQNIDGISYETLSPESAAMFKALTENTLPKFVLEHTEFVTQ
jgi:LCP family protein required for cell wall assembly